MKPTFLTLLLVGIFTVCTDASHLRGGYITVEQVNSSSLTCRITIVVYTNSLSAVSLGSSFSDGKNFILDFGDGTNTTVPETYSFPQPDFGPNIGIASFTVMHTYAGPGSYLVNYQEPGRNAGILNAEYSFNTNFYTETFVVLDVGFPYNTPHSLISPILFGLSGQEYSSSMAQFDVHDNQLVYQLTTPKSDHNVYLSNYRIPENFSIDPISGLISWDSKFNGLPAVGEFAFAVSTYQIRDGKLVGYMVRDFQIIVEDKVDSGDGINGGVFENDRVYTPENSTVHLRVDAGSTANEIDLEITSELDNYPVNFSYDIEDSVHTNTNYKVAKILFTNTPAIDRTNPYIITARATFTGPQGITKKDIVYVVATKDIFYNVPLILHSSEETAAAIKIYPNPVQHYLYISNSENRSVAVSIFDLSGKVYYKDEIAESTSIDVRSLSAGIYLCSLLVNDRRVIYKIIKE